MIKEKHIERHKELHAALDELMADWLTHTKCLPSKNTVMDLAAWSHQQTIEPTGGTEWLI